jgi:hypothetical protein
MLSLNLVSRRAAALFVVAVILTAVAVVPAWCVATGMWW